MARPAKEIESQEFQVMKENAPWLGAILGATGTMAYGPHRGVRYGRVYQNNTFQIALTSQDPRKINHLEAVFGGSNYPAKNSRRWLVAGNRAAVIGSLILPFAPSRAYLGETINNHVASNNLVLEEPEMLKCQPYSYEEIAQNPDCAGGLVDWLGYPYDNDVESADTTPEFELKSANHSLLLALQREHGGYFSEKDLRAIALADTSIKLRWMLAGDDSYRFLSWAHERFDINPSAKAA